MRLRHAPVQERSNETIQQILAAASSLLGKIPLDQVTTSRIAGAAGISIGGLYRFFPDKQAIIDAIAVGAIEEFRASLETTLKASGGVDPRQFLELVIDAYVAFLDARPDFRAIALSSQIGAATRERQLAAETGPAALVKSFIAGLGLEASSELDLKIRIATESGDRLIAFAFAQPSREERGRVVAEMKRLLCNYLFGAGN